MTGGTASSETIVGVWSQFDFIVGLVSGILIAYAITTGERRDARASIREARAAAMRPDEEGTVPIPGRHHYRKGRHS